MCHRIRYAMTDKNPSRLKGARAAPGAPPGKTTPRPSGGLIAAGHWQKAVSLVVG